MRYAVAVTRDAIHTVKQILGHVAQPSVEVQLFLPLLVWANVQVKSQISVLLFLCLLLQEVQMRASTPRAPLWENVLGKLGGSCSCESMRYWSIRMTALCHRQCFFFLFVFLNRTPTNLHLRNKLWNGKNKHVQFGEGSVISEQLVLLKVPFVLLGS